MTTSTQAEVRYGMGGYLWYTKHTFERAEEGSQADKKGKTVESIASIDYIDQILEPFLAVCSKAPGTFYERGCTNSYGACTRSPWVYRSSRQLYRICSRSQRRYVWYNWVMFSSRLNFAFEVLDGRGRRHMDPQFMERTVISCARKARGWWWWVQLRLYTRSATRADMRRDLNKVYRPNHLCRRAEIRNRCRQRLWGCRMRPCWRSKKKRKMFL